AADEAGAEDPSGSGWSDGGTDAAETDAAQEETAGTDDSEASDLPAQTTEPDAAEGAETGAQIPEEISGEESAEQTVPADGFSEDEIPTDLVLIEDAEEEVYIPAKEEAAEADNDGLFAAYVNRELGLEGDLQADTGNSVAQERAAKSHYASTRLKENEKSIYGVLLRKIREVAAGESTSTQLTVTLKETGFAGKTWTAGELGVKQIVEYVDGNYKITEDAKAALKITLGNLNKALLADCPCDLYWYDKTKGVSCTHFKYGAAYIDGEYRIYYSGESKYSFAVSMDYRPLGGTDLYVTDTGIGESVRTARETALSIVDKYKNMSDYEKLDGYRKEICGLVSYNHAAINNDDTPYGDPWQLIWTFDGDQTTNVVCEGYSKSFQYLCDLTAWNDIFRECISVSGTMYGSGGGGRHMWNIVRLRDGSNYLADITNCDSGTVGAGNDGRSLFLVGTGDSAEYAGYASGNAADGYSFPGLSASLRYVYDEEACDRFGEEFLALSPGRVTADTVAAGAYTGNHEHIFVPLEELPADCIHTGHSAGLQCAICGVFDDSVQYYPVTNVHSPGTWKVTKEPTYDEQGTETTSCTVCGRTLTRAVAKKEPAAQTFTVSGSSIPVFSTGRITINGTARGTVTYGSSNPSVAMVNRDSGEITAKAAGSATITVTAAGTKEFKARTQSTTVTVTALSLVADDVTVAADGLVYNGNAKTPAVTVKHGGRTLQSGTDYAVTYTNNTNAGTAKVTVTGKGNYKGSASRSFTIAKASQSVTAQAAAASVCAGRSTKLTVTGAKGEKTFSSSNTTIASVNSTTGQVTAKKVGTVSITVSCAATTNYKAASAKVTIKVLPAAVTSLKAENLAKGIKITWNRVAGANGYLIYRNDKKIRTISGGATLTYSDPNANTNGAKYIYKVVAKAATGTSTLSKSVTFYRVARTSFASVQNKAERRAVVKWYKIAKATGYQIQYSPSKTFSGDGTKTVNITKQSVTARTFGNLKKGRTLYFRIRTCKKVGTVIYRSAWSPLKKVTISK
ncbi:MAG: Ig-like domain-containing protein, partial [Eubacteriales bacterium]|nr:Ig-like domain-containing protein [Eubacteriales bacterium]